MYYLNGPDILSVKEEVSFFPNPVTGISVLKIPVQYLPKYSNADNFLCITDISVRCVKQMKIPASGEAEIKKNDFAPGMYFYTCLSLPFSGKIVIP